MSEWFPTARLACLIHAANVHSEPESNPSIGIYMKSHAPVAYASSSPIYEPIENLSGLHEARRFHNPQPYGHGLL